MDKSLRYAYNWRNWRIWQLFRYKYQRGGISWLISSFLELCCHSLGVYQIMFAIVSCSECCKAGWIQEHGRTPCYTLTCVPPWTWSKSNQAYLSKSYIKLMGTHKFWRFVNEVDRKLLYSTVSMRIFSLPPASGPSIISYFPPLRTDYRRTPGLCRCSLPPPAPISSCPSMSTTHAAFWH